MPIFTAVINGVASFYFFGSKTLYTFIIINKMLLVEGLNNFGFMAPLTIGCVFLEFLTTQDSNHISVKL